MTVTVPADATLEQLKQSLWRQEGIPVSHQQFVVGFRLVQDGATLAEQGICQQSVLRLWRKGGINHSETRFRRGTGLVTSVCVM